MSITMKNMCCGLSIVFKITTRRSTIDVRKKSDLSRKNLTTGSPGHVQKIWDRPRPGSLSDLQTHLQTEGQIDGWTNGLTDWQTDKAVSIELLAADEKKNKQMGRWVPNGFCSGFCPHPLSTAHYQTTCYCQMLSADSLMSCANCVCLPLGKPIPCNQFLPQIHSSRVVPYLGFLCSLWISERAKLPQRCGIKM